MNTGVLLWALWITAGGNVNSGYLKQTYIAAYFATEAECTRVQKLVAPETRWTICIQAAYAVAK